MSPKGENMIEIDPGLRAVSVPFMVLDADGKILLWNHACSELTGYGFDEVRGKCPWDCLAPTEEAQRARLSFQEALTRRGITVVGCNVLDRQGGRHWIDWAHDIVRRSDGSVDFVRAIGLERTNAERAEMRRLSERVIARAGDAIVAVDERQQIVLYNEFAEGVFGWAQAEALGKDLDLLMPYLEGTGARDVHHTALCLLARRKSGEEFPVDATISGFDEDGARLSVIVLRDCSEQKRLEREQRVLAELSAAVCDAADLAEMLTNLAQLSVRFLADCCTIYWLDEDNTLHTKVVHADPRKAKIADALERVRLDPSQKHLCSAAMDDRRPSVVPKIAPDHLEQLEQSEEYRRLVRKLEPVACVSLPLVSRERGLGAIVLISCDAKRSFGPDDVMLGQQVACHAAGAIERELLHRSAIHAAQTQKQVLSIVAHDLRNPIGAARLAIQRLMREDGEERREFSRKTLELVLRALDRVGRLVQDLLELSQVEAGQINLRCAPVAADEIVSEVVEMFAPTAVAASLRIDTELEARLPRVLADKDRIHQLFSNLVGNAIKFTGAGGRIYLGAERRDGQVCFWVRDTGEGITPEELPHVFDRFWQSRHGYRRGVGLGLGIARGIVAAHGGRIWVQSIPGAGSTFFFTLPTAPQQRRGVLKRHPRVAC
jgi:PAS domain S-box-containing protein